MTADEYAEAQQLVGSGMLHARMLPLLRAALDQFDHALPPEYVETFPGIWEWRVWAHNGRYRYVVARSWQVYPTRDAAEAEFRSIGFFKEMT